MVATAGAALQVAAQPAEQPEPEQRDEQPGRTDGEQAAPDDRPGEPQQAGQQQGEQQLAESQQAESQQAESQQAGQQQGEQQQAGQQQSEQQQAQQSRQEQPDQQQPDQQQPQQQPGQQAQQDAGQQPDGDGAAAAAGEGCGNLPSHGEITELLEQVVAPGEQNNGGLGNDMWAVVVDREGTICAVTRTGDEFAAQWPGSRAIAASKAFTANAFSLPGFALSTANLYWPAQPENGLYGLGQANPISPVGLYGGEASTWGTPEDPLTGRRMGGTIVFGGGLALYSAEGGIIGALGVSGDESCTDHIIAWKLRHELNFDAVPDGVARGGTDNIVHDLSVDPASGQRKSAGGYGHPVCNPESRRIAMDLPQSAPPGEEP